MERSQPCRVILANIKTSYDRLNDDLLKDVILDIGCFFIGMNKNYARQYLGAVTYIQKKGILELQNQCLVTVDTEGNLIRDMAREIVHAQCPDHPEEHSRLWHQVDVIDVLGKQSPWVMKRETVIAKRIATKILTEVGPRKLFVTSMREDWVAKNAKQPAPKPVDMSVSSNNLVKDGARGSDAFYGGGSCSSSGKIP